MLEQLLLCTGWSSVQFFNVPPFSEHSQLGHTWYPAPHCTELVWLMGRHATLLLTMCFPTNPF